jgi:hypothetical protein
VVAFSLVATAAEDRLNAKERAKSVRPTKTSPASTPASPITPASTAGLASVSTILAPRMRGSACSRRRRARPAPAIATSGWNYQHNFLFDIEGSSCPSWNYPMAGRPNKPRKGD